MSMVASAVMVILLSACSTPSHAPSERVPTGTLTFSLNDTTQVRIPGVWQGDTLILRNSNETLTLKPSDSLDPTWAIPVFDGRLTLQSDTGFWQDVLRPGTYRVPVRWQAETQAETTPAWTGDTLSWALTFGADDPWYGQLFLQQSGISCRGSIATATGDFRYLHGSIEGDGTLRLQTFDGAHLFCFAANLGDDGSLSAGTFWSGTHYATSFYGTPLDAGTTALEAAPKAEWTGLPVFYAGIALDGDSTSWEASNADHLHVLSIMGSWCPNCMDEHRLLATLMEQHPTLHVHTLAFERGLDKEGGTQRALDRLARYSDHMGLDRFGDRWHVVLTGPASKTRAQAALPFLDRVVSFPTTIVVGGGGAPWIHSGFNGPAMGPAHDLEVARFAAAVSGSTESR